MRLPLKNPVLNGIFYVIIMITPVVCLDIHET
jgi:hypothetical protein